ncbi:hypothetical protein GW846_01740 [Candidatus Gracilibacteria bacterium]|nr:hypothetical protein [Candidatus Gracilibacteria bacterium]
MLRKRIILLILLAISIVSGASFTLLLVYFDPYTYPTLAIAFLVLSFGFSLTSFLSLVIYFFKKIYFRGEVRMMHVITSLRQSFFFTIFLLSLVLIYVFQIPFLLPAALSFILIVLIELFIQGL